MLYNSVSGVIRCLGNALRVITYPLIGEFSVMLVTRLARPGDLLDLGVAQVPEFQPLAGRCYQRVTLLDRVPKRAVLQHVLALQGQKVFLLRRQHLRAVERQQSLPFLNDLAGEIDEDLLDPALHPGVNAGDAGFVKGDLANGPEGMDPGPGFNFAVTHADQLLLLGTDLNGAHRHGGGLVRIHRFQFIPGLGVEPRLIGGIVGILRVAVVQELSLGRGCGRFPAVLIDGLQLHPAVRRDARLVRFVGRVHRVDVVENLPAAFLGGAARILAIPTAVAVAGHEHGNNQQNHQKSSNDFHGACLT